jgi:hypothetical protein
MTEVRLTWSCLAMARLLTPSLRRRFISGTSLAAVWGLPWGLPSLRAWLIPAFTRSRRMSRSNSAKCGEPHFADYAECGIMRSHAAETAAWPAYR